MDGLQRCFDQLAWPEADQAAKQPGATIVWPFGACEQHGPQLPLATDALFADRILNSVFEHLEAALPIWRLPVQSIGFSPEHQPFPGTLSLSAELMLQLVEQVGGQLAAMGVERLVLLNAHGGQIGHSPSRCSNTEFKIRSANNASVAKGSWGPCCSQAPKGQTTVAPACFAAFSASGHAS